MSTVEQLEQQIRQLDPAELAQFSTWFEAYVTHESQAWDRQIERDAQPGGPLSALARKALAQHAAGQTTRL
jgi:hypothetical protein